MQNNLKTGFFLTNNAYHDVKSLGCYFVYSRYLIGTGLLFILTCFSS